MGQIYQSFPFLLVLFCVLLLKSVPSPMFFMVFLSLSSRSLTILPFTLRSPSIWNLLLLTICDGSQVSPFPYRCQTDTAAFTIITVLSLQPLNAIIVMDRESMYMWVCSKALYSASLTYLSILALILACLNYCNFIISLDS